MLEIKRLISKITHKGKGKEADGDTQQVVIVPTRYQINRQEALERVVRKEPYINPGDLTPLTELNEVLPLPQPLPEGQEGDVSRFELLSPYESNPDLGRDLDMPEELDK